VRYVSVGVYLLFLSNAAAAQDVARPSHVRAESIDVRQLIAETAQRSTTFRSLVEEIDRSSVIVYVRVRLLASQALDGRTGLLGARFGTRYLAIELACPRSRDTQMATLAHELQHALEIADASWVVDAPTLARHYRRIGIALGDTPGGATFETDAAQAIGARVRHELHLDTMTAERR
jgi:hypothetical protein